MSLGNSPGTYRKDSPKLMLGERYKTDTYRCAIARACDRAFPPPAPLAKRDGESKAKWRKRLTKKQRHELAAWRKAHRCHPHRPCLPADLSGSLSAGLSGVALAKPEALAESQALAKPEARRRRIGIEAARILLGHRFAAITEVYAENDEQQAIEAAVQVG